MLKKYPKILVTKALSSFGLEIRKIINDNTLPRIFDNPKEALLFNQGGKPAGFLCPVNECTHYTGIGLSDSDRNPFVETLKQYENNPTLTYEDSILKKFYESWIPKNAAEMIIEFDNAPKIFESYPPHYLFLSPWSSLSASEVDQDGRWWNQKDNEEHGCGHLQFPEDGWTFSGPVHPEKGRVEFHRFINLYKNIRDNGYDHSKGLIGVTQLKRNDEYRYLIGGGGFHRAIVLAALGVKFLPARFHRTSTVDTRDIDAWPQVKQELWSKEQALSYIDLLFMKSSNVWSTKIDLIDS
jgi:hypothetical protein